MNLSKLSRDILVVCLLALLTGCVVIAPSHAGNGSSEGLSAKGTAREFGRGVTNVAFSWLEVPHEVEDRVRDNRSGSPFAIISHTVDVALGAVGGTINTAERAVGGAVEVGLSPFPPYDPLMSPALPPYLAATGKDHAHSHDEGERETCEGSVAENDGVFTQTITREMPFKSGGKLHAATRNGAITITPWDKPHILIEAEKKMRVRPWAVKIFLMSFRSRKPFKNDEDAEKYFSRIKVDISGTEDDVRVKTEMPDSKSHVSVSVAYNIKVPSRANLNLETSNGTVRVTGIDGTIEIHTSNGKIHCEETAGDVSSRTSNGMILMEGVSGKVDAHTSNGEIRVTMTKPLGADESIGCTTSNGRISATLPEGSSFDLDANTSNGSITCEFPVTNQRGSRKRSLSGTVGDGGPQVKLRTSNGAIKINKSHG